MKVSKKELKDAHCLLRILKEVSPKALELFDDFVNGDPRKQVGDRSRLETSQKLLFHIEQFSEVLCWIAGMDWHRFEHYDSNNLAAVTNTLSAELTRARAALAELRDDETTACRIAQLEPEDLKHPGNRELFSY